jgi:hypothetical protein
MTGYCWSVTRWPDQTIGSTKPGSAVFCRFIPLICARLVLTPIDASVGVRCVGQSCGHKKARHKAGLFRLFSLAALSRGCRTAAAA